MDTPILDGVATTPAFETLMALRGRGRPEVGEVSITGRDPFYATPFRVGGTIASILAATGVVSNDIWAARGGRRQRVSVSVPHAAASIRMGDYARIQGADGRWEAVPIPASMAHMYTVTQPWRTRDGRYFLPHLNLDHLSARVRGVLRCEDDAAGVSGAVAQWDADELEQAIADARACGGTVRSRAEWLAHPQGRYLAARPVIEITRIGDSAPEPFTGGRFAGVRPLSGVRVLDLTRILAGPISGRTMAEHGADVLMVTAPHLPQTVDHVRDTSHGKRSCFIDLSAAEGVAQLRALVATADVFTNGYRPGSLAARGFTPEELARVRPGIIHLSVSCYGSGGPFAERAGWEQVAQTVTGMAETQGRMTGAEKPELVPAPVCDYTTGYLAGLGAMLALERRAREGGSYTVSVSLCRSGMFIQDQGLLTEFAGAAGRLGEAEAEAVSVEEDSPHGRLRSVGPALRMSETPPRWALPTPKLGSSAAEWAA